MSDAPRPDALTVDLDAMDIFGLSGNERLLMAHLSGIFAGDEARIVTAAEIRWVTGQRSDKGAMKTLKSLRDKGLVAICFTTGKGWRVIPTDLALRVSERCGAR